nr:uncharacterized protein LOC110000873 [Labrus bergylta]
MEWHGLPVCEDQDPCSPAPSCDSMESDRSKGSPPYFDEKIPPISDARWGDIGQTFEEKDDLLLSPRSKCEDQGQSSPASSCESMKSDRSKGNPPSFDEKIPPISDARRGDIGQTFEETDDLLLSPRSKAHKRSSEVVGGRKTDLGSILKPQHQVRSLIGLSPAKGSGAVGTKHLTTPKARRRRSKSDDVKKFKTGNIENLKPEENYMYWKMKAQVLQSRVDKLEKQNRSLKQQLEGKSAAKPGVRCRN